MKAKWDFPVRKGNSTPVEVTINQPLNDALVEHLTLDGALKEYLSLKGQVERLQERMKEVRIPIEEALALRGETMEIGDFLCTLQPCERENFNLSEAKKHLKPSVLKPYISVSKYTQLRIRGKE